MGVGLSLAEQIEEFRKSGVQMRAGDEWSGKLEEWLATVLPAGAYERYDIRHSDYTPGVDGPRDDESVLDWTERCRAGVQTWAFPTRDLRMEYLQSISTRTDEDIFALLRLFLFEESYFARDTEYLHEAHYIRKDPSKPNWLPTEYWTRLHHWVAGNTKPHPSIRWTLDLLPDSPQQAIEAIMGYLHVYRGIRPSGRTQGLLDAIAIIRARWIENVGAVTEALFRLSPRDLEVLVAALYRELGYDVELTPPSRDGGRDVIARKVTPGRSEVVEIECKAHTAPVGVEIARQLQGVISRDRANRGVLVTTSRFTRGALKEASEDNRLELVDGATLASMLNAMFGPLWAQDRSRICRNLT